MLVLAALLGLAALSGPVQLAAALLVLGALLGWGWAGALALPSAHGTAGVLAASALLITGSVLVGGEGRSSLELVPVAVCGALVLAFLHQLLRRDGRPRLVESISSVVLGLALLAGGVLMVPLATDGTGALLVLLAVVAAAASAVVDLTGRWVRTRAWLVPAALVAGGASAVTVAVLARVDVAWTTCLLLGVAGGAVSQAVRMLFSVLPSMAGRRPRLVAAAASLLVVGPVVYTVARVLVPDVLPH